MQDVVVSGLYIRLLLFACDQTPEAQVPSLFECKSPEEPVAMHWHTVRFDAGAKRVEIYRHAADMFDGDPLILIDADLERFGRTPEGMEQLATWLGRIVLADNPAVRKAVGL